MSQNQEVNVPLLLASISDESSMRQHFMSRIAFQKPECIIFAYSLAKISDSVRVIPI